MLLRAFRKDKCAVVLGLGVRVMSQTELDSDSNGLNRSFFGWSAVRVEPNGLSLASEMVTLIALNSKLSPFDLLTQTALRNPTATWCK